MPRESTIQIFRSTTPASVPSGLTQGELAVNLEDLKLYVGGTAGQSVDIIGQTCVTRINGATGNITSIAVTGSNTFTGLQTMTAGITASHLWVTNGATFAGRSSFNAGITASNLYVTTGATFAARTAFPAGLTSIRATITNLNSDGATFSSLYSTSATIDGILATKIQPTTIPSTLYLNVSDDETGGGNGRTIIGDISAEGSGTYIDVDDSLGTIVISSPASGIYHVGSFTNEISAPSFADTYSFCQTYQTTTTATTANQTIATISNVYDNTQIPAVMGYPAFEVTISAQDTVANKTEMLKMLVVQDGTNTVNTQYGLIRTGATGPVSSYTTTLSGTPKDLLIRATPSSANSTKFTVTVRAHYGL